MTFRRLRSMKLVFRKIQPLYLKGLNFHYVKDIKEVLTLALTDEKVADAIDFTVTDEKKEEK